MRVVTPTQATHLMLRDVANVRTPAHERPDQDSVGGGTMRTGLKRTSKHAKPSGACCGTL